MRLMVDGIIFQKDPYSGIARLYREILPRVCDHSPGLSVSLFIDGPLQSQIPTHPQIELRQAPSVRIVLRPSGRWRRVLYPFRRVISRTWNHARQAWVGNGVNQIWHSTFYTYQPGWRGAEVVTVHDMAPELFPELFSDPMDAVGREQKKRCIERAAAVICDSEATSQDLKRLLPLDSKPIHIIPLAHSEAFQRLPNNRIDPQIVPALPFILYVGSRVHYKNFSFLLDVFAAWEKRNEIHLVLAGPPLTSEEKNTLKAKGLSELVQHAGVIDDSALSQLYNTAAALVFPSLIEGFGLPLLEAMACGCPIAASEIASTVEVAGDCPVYFDPYDPLSLSNALNRVVSEGRGSARVNAGLERSGLYSWDRTARLYLDVYEGLAVD